MKRKYKLLIFIAIMVILGLSAIVKIIAHGSDITPVELVSEPIPVSTTVYAVEEIVFDDKEEIPTVELIDKEELDLLAHLIFAEAGSDWCDDEMLYGVGSVVLNRMASEHFPSTMYDVIYQTKPTLQYACIVDGNIKKEPNERAYRIAEDLLRNGPTMPANVLYQAQFKQGDGVHIKIQNMYFCYINEEGE